NTSESAQLTDAGNARFFAVMHRNIVRYSHTSKTWLIWDGSRWGKDRTAEVQRLAKEALKHLWSHACEIEDEDRRKRFMNNTIKSQYEVRIGAMIRLAQSEPEMALTDTVLDCDPWLLNVKNGTLDLRTGSLRAHRQEDLITKIAPVEFSPTAKSPMWTRFLET